MKAYMMTDLEGVAGVVSFASQSYPDGRYHDQAKRLLSAEINAAVEGLVEEGVDEVLVHDGHGCGGVWYEDLRPPARLIHGRPGPPRRVLDGIVKDCELCLMIGQHAMAGIATGNQNHTQSSRAIDYYKLNGKPIGEIAQFALYQGGFDMPMVFLSGDEEACREAKALIPGLTTVAVKTGLGRNAALSLAAPEARRRIKEGVQRALQRQREKPLAPLKWKGPYVLEKRFFHTDTADGASSAPDAERVDAQSVRFHAERIQEIAYR